MIWRWSIAMALSAGLVLGVSVIPRLDRGVGAAPPLDRDNWPECAVGAPSLENSERSALVLYDSGEPWNELARVYADFSATLASHFAEVEVLPARDYLAGRALQHDVTIYVGLNYAELLPVGLLEDVAEGERPILWLGENLWQLGSSEVGAGNLEELYGMRWMDESAAVQRVQYRDSTLSVPADTTVHRVTDLDLTRVAVLATAEAKDLDEPVPYAVRSGSLTWLAEVPLNDAAGDDRYLVLADLLNDAFDVAPPPTRRALVRLEDIGPLANPADLRDAADALSSRQIPFAIALYPLFLGAPEDELSSRALREAPEVVKAIEYMIDRGGTLVLHGYTHQYADVPNPLSGRSGEDFEFFRVHREGDVLIHDGPVPEDSAEWVRGRLNLAMQELDAVGLPRPAIFEFPHYGASATAYHVVDELFLARYDHIVVSSPAWNGEPPIDPYLFRLSPPYLVRDPYGTVTIPETLGFLEDGWTDVEAGLDPAARMLAQADALSVVRGSLSSLFFHPYLGAESLVEIVDGLAASGHEFVSPCTLQPIPKG